MIADLRELDRAHRGGRAARGGSAWTETWREARAFLARAARRDRHRARARRGGQPVGLGSTVRRRAGALALGSHLDSVPAGGWLDGALGVMAGLGVLRAWARPTRTPTAAAGAGRLGRRGGRALRPQPVRQLGLLRDPRSSMRCADLRDATGVALDEALAANGVELDRALEAGARRERLGAYLELHIEQGPVLEARGHRAPRRCEGCAGVERHRFRFTGQASHAGTTPMEHAPRRRPRRRGGRACGSRRSADEHDGVATTGSLEPRSRGSRPRSPGGGSGRRPAPPRRDRARGDARRRPGRGRSTRPRPRGCELAQEPLWRIEPIPFDPAWSRRPARPARRSAARSRRSPAAPCTTPPRWRGCCRRRWSSAPRSPGSATPAGGHLRGRPGGRDRGLRAAGEPGARQRR